MLASIKKFSKSVFGKIFIAIIALPFLLWGMGDIFSSGKQNVLVEINKEKVNLKEFITYLQKINITQKDLDSNGKSKLIDDILTNYISEKIIEIEAKKMGIQLSDEALKNILISDKAFSKDNKFSRTKYEKFLLKNNFNAPTYERFIKNVEVKGQLLNYYSGGIKIPEFLIRDLYKKEKNIKDIEFIDLNKIYEKKIIQEQDITKFYDDNKSLFNEKFISFKYAKLTPSILTKKKEFDEEYYEKLDEIENKILDGKKFNELISDSKKNVKSVKFINARKIREDGTDFKDLDDKIFERIFLIKDKNIPQFINVGNNYYIAEILEEKDITLTLKDKDLKRTIQSQLKIKFKMDENQKLSEKINRKELGKKSMIDLANKNKVLINNLKINGINDTRTFSLEMVNKIYNNSVDNIFILTDPILSQNFLVRIVKEQSPKIKNNSDEYEEYKKKTNAKYIAKIYKSYDKYINENYKIVTNEKVLERLKNSF